MTPRIPPADPDAVDDEMRKVLDSLSGLRGGVVHHLNVFTTLAQHPDLFKSWLPFGGHVLVLSTLPPRDRELAILRSGWRCSSPYEWGQHVVVARRAGIDDEEIARIAQGPDAPGWSDGDAAILRAVDELHDRSTITATTWDVLSRRYDRRQLMDLVFTIGQYHLVSYALNAFGVERDDGASGVPFPEPA